MKKFYPILEYENSRSTEIQNYLEKHHYEDNDVFVNGFTYKNKRYPLNEEMCKDLYKIIMQLPINAQEETVKNQATFGKLYSNILDALKKTVNNLTDPSILKQKQIYFTEFFALTQCKEADLIALASIICDNLSHIMVETIWSTFEKKSPIFQATFTDLALTIGLSIITWLFEKSSVKLRYKVPEEDKLTPEEQAELFSSEESLQNFYLSEKIGDILYLKKNISIKFRHWYENAHFIHALSKTPLPPKTFLALAKYQGISNEDDEKLLKLQKAIPIVLGTFFVEILLLKHNILEDTIVSDTVDTVEDKKVPQKKTLKEGRANVVMLQQEYIADMTLAHSYYKPLLDPGIPIKTKTTVEKHPELPKIEFNLHSKTNSNYANKFNYDRSEALKEVLVPNIQYSINIPFLECYINYLKDIYRIPFSVLLKIFEILDLTKDDISFRNKLLNYLQDLTVENIFDTNFYRKLNASYKEAKISHKNAYKAAKDNNTITGENLSSFLFQENNKFLDELKDKVSREKLKLDLYTKIAAKKYFLIQFLTDVNLYKDFDHFYIPQEISGIGRIQTIIHFLSLQGNKLATALIVTNSTGKTIDPYMFDKFKTILSTSLPEAINEISTLTYDAYINKTKKIQEEYIISFFKDITLEELFHIDITNLKSAVNFCINNNKFKKIKTAFIGLSMLHYTEYKTLYQNKEPFVYYDSTTSGTQHVATIFCDLKAAKHSCLAGTEKVDINKIFLKQFESFITQGISKISTEYLTTLNSCRETANKHLNVNFLKNLHKLVCKTLKINYKNVDFKTLDDFFTYIFTLYKKNDFQDLKNIPEIPTSFMQECCTLFDKNLKIIQEKFSIENKKLTEYLLVTILDNIIITIFETLPWIKSFLGEREIIKKTIMAECYGMTMYGGIRAIYDAFIDKAFETGFYKINLRYLRIFSTIMASYFAKHFREHHLNYMQNLRKITSYAKYLSGPLKYSHEYLTWEYAPKKIKTFRIAMQSCLGANESNNFMPNSNMKSNYRYHRRFINVSYVKDEIDKRKIRSAMLAFIIQTVEAYLLMYWLMVSKELKIQLSDNFNISLNYTPNYDCFGTNFSNAALLELSLKHSYKHNYQQPFYIYIQKMFENSSKEHQYKWREVRNYIKSLRNAPFTENYWDGEITNPFYVKPWQ